MGTHLPFLFYHQELYIMSPTNAERAQWAEDALDAFSDAAKMEGEDDKTVMSDLLANLMHFARQNGIDFESALTMARTNFEHEVIYG
jgi:hypothetical protein